jgi:hypothetical protein
LSRPWVARENAEWIPKTDILPLNDLQRWMSNKDIEVLGFVSAMLHDRRFRIESPMQRSDYIEFIKHYFERCLHKNPDGEWSDSRYTAGPSSLAYPNRGNFRIADHRVPRARKEKTLNSAQLLEW